jgi:hypothetical protein
MNSFYEDDSILSSISTAETERSLHSWVTRLVARAKADEPYAQAALKKVMSIQQIDAELYLALNSRRPPR